MEGDKSDKEVFEADDLSVNAPRPPDINDFTILKPISKGAFGKVFLGKRKTDNRLYAIKVSSSSKMISDVYSLSYGREFGYLP